VRVEFDAAKNLRNIETRGLSFELVQHLDWETALSIEDTRKDYGERRFRVLGMIGGLLYAVVITPRSGGMRVISLRRANLKERSSYAEATSFEETNNA
jgi:uncharacterized DUF497 family protein